MITDIKFENLQHRLLGSIINLNTVSRIEHVPEVNDNIRVFMEIIHVCFHTIPLKADPKLVMAEMTNYSELMMLTSAARPTTIMVVVII